MLKFNSRAKTEFVQIMVSHNSIIHKARAGIPETHDKERATPRKTAGIDVVALFQAPIVPMRYHHLNGLSDALTGQFVAVLYGLREELRVRESAARFPHRFARGLRLTLKRRHSHYETRELYFPIALPWLLFSLRPRSVLASGTGIPSLIALIYCRVFGKRLVIYGEGTPFTERGITPFQWFLRRNVFARFAEGFLVVGSQSRRYVESLGVPAERIWVAPQSTDTVLFWRLAEQARLTQPRSSLQPPRLVYVGQLIRRKGIHLLIGIFGRLRQRWPGAELWLIGDGAERPSLERQVQESGLSSAVRFWGQIENERLPEMFAACDVFVFPSLEDTFAVVIPEAMAAGLPVVCNCGVGAVDDLIMPGRTGFVVDFTNSDNAVDAIRLCLAQATEMGKAARDLALSWDVSITVERTLMALGLQKKPK